ncbi:MAG TPA: HAD-IA family hydrolase, partial [Gemmatimonadales bacterium]|nr:HAD-IA family hydrolase [Gemmatimonadales bacterium]
MSQLQTVLFDLDGTLIDSIRLILDSYHHTLTQHNLPARSDEEWLRGVGTPLHVQFSQWHDSPEKLEAMIATYREFNLKHHDRMVTVYPGVVEAVRQIKSSGIQTGLVTSKNRQGALRGLALVGLEALMDVMVCADEVSNPKPHPEPVEKAVALLGADPARTVYVGDSIHDMHSGRA